MNSHSPIRSSRGSLLIVAMILATVIGISLVSYMHLGRTSLTISNRAFYNNAAINLAENGLEEAMYSINQSIANPSYSWDTDEWHNNGNAANSAAWKRFSDTNFDQNTRGSVRVYVYNYKGVVAPKIVTRARIRLGDRRTAAIEKWLEVTLRKTSKFANGLVAKNSIVFNGTNSSVDSWNSVPTALSPPVPYSSAVRSDNGSVGSISVAVDMVLIKQADIWGFVATGGADPTTSVGNNGSILGSTSLYDPATWSTPRVDPSRVSTDFAANFEPVVPPSKTYIVLPNGTLAPSPSSALSPSLPRAIDAPDADGYYYYITDRIDLNNNTLTITDKVVLQLTRTAGNAIDVAGGSGAIQTTGGGSLAIYTEGDVNIGGQGIANGTDLNSDGALSDIEVKQPINFQIWGTKTSGAQNISLTGQGTLSAIVYAPQGNVTVNGNGSVSGSVVANNITLTGNANFHYDESLGNFGGGNPFRVSKWKELTTAADRNDYATDLRLDNDHW